MTEIEPCLVVNLKTGQWSLQDRAPVPAAIEPWNEWSSDVWSDKLKKACEGYRKRGERSGPPATYVTRERRAAKLRLRRKFKFMEAAE